MLSLRDVLSRAEADTKPLKDLTDTEQADLTAERIRRQKTFEIGLIGVGVLDKERAIAEVKANSPAGRTLMAIEKKILEMVLEAARETARREKAP
jgi:hypothetical protein